MGWDRDRSTDDRRSTMSSYGGEGSRYSARDGYTPDSSYRSRDTDFYSTPDIGRGSLYGGSSNLNDTRQTGNGAACMVPSASASGVPAVFPYTVSASKLTTTIPPAEKVKIGALILSRGSVYQYATNHIIDRREQPITFWTRIIQDCFPCCENCRVDEPMVEAHIGEAIPLKSYVEDIEQKTYENRHLDSIGRNRVWRWFTGDFSIFLLLLFIFLLGTLKCLTEASADHQSFMTLFETVLALVFVLIRVLQCLVVYWGERELRQSMEVTAWDDGIVTRGRPLSLFITMWVYGSLQIMVCCLIIFGNLSLSATGHGQWTLLTTTLPVFLLTQFPSVLLLGHLQRWRARVTEDHLRLGLVETSDILEEIWYKLRECELQNKVHTFREALISSYQLDTYRLSYMRK